MSEFYSSFLSRMGRSAPLRRNATTARRRARKAVARALRVRARSATRLRNLPFHVWTNIITRLGCAHDVASFSLASPYTAAVVRNAEVNATVKRVYSRPCARCTRIFLPSELHRSPCETCNGLYDAKCIPAFGRCHGCGNVVCDHCNKECDNCASDWACETCIATCGVCGKNLCNWCDASFLCKVCGHWTCRDHHQDCECGRRIVCNRCIHFRTENDGSIGEKMVWCDMCERLWCDSEFCQCIYARTSSCYKCAGLQ